MESRFSGCRVRHPVRHRRKDPFRPVVQVPADFPRRALELRRLDAELDRFILSAGDYMDLVVDAFATNVHYSTKLEGNPLPLEEVRRLTRNSFEGLRGGTLDKPRQEIINHLMAWVSPGTFETPWSVEMIRFVHQYLMEGVEPESLPGEFRKGPAYITQGRDVVFQGADPRLVPDEMRSLADWLNGQGIALFPVVAATVFFHEFESIHPFRDGNGRTGRTLFHAYLQNHGLPNASLCKVEYEITKDPETYYLLLGWTDQEESYTELVDYVTDCTLAAYRSAIGAFRAKDLLTSDLEEAARRILVRAKQKKAWFKVAEAVGWVSGIGEQTVRRHLNGLVERGVLEAEGQTKAKRYRFADPLRNAREAAVLPRP